MKFDRIIMNPPYSRNLHMKILAETQNHISQTGKIICLHPGKWLQRFDYWKTKSTIKVENAEFIDIIKSKNIFDAVIGSNLVISTVSMNGDTDYKKFSKFLPWVKEKIIDKTIVLSSKNAYFKTTNPSEPFILNLPIIHGNIGCYSMTEITSKVYERALTVKFGKRKQDINSLKFNSELERKNFYNSTFTHFYKFLIITCRDGQTATSCYYALPWMGDAINPRTGKKGYESEWTDDDFVRYFNITPDEYNIINKYISKYENN